MIVVDAVVVVDVVVDVVVLRMILKIQLDQEDKKRASTTITYA